MTYLEPEGVTVEDGNRLRHDVTWLVLDDGRVRELRLRVGRGIVRDTRAQADTMSAEAVKMAQSDKCGIYVESRAMYCTKAAGHEDYCSYVPPANGIAAPEAEPARLAALLESDTGGWRPMGSAPRDGTAVLAAIEVWNRQGIPRAWWERHVVWCHDETGMIHPDADHGWEWDDYLHWHPLPAPPASEVEP